MQQLLEEEDELGKNVSSHNMLVKNLCIKLHSFASTMTILKIITIYVYGCEKRKPKHVYIDWSEIRFEKLIFLNLDGQSIYRAASESQAKATFQTSIDARVSNSKGK